jgi:preprotein translocase subunit SecA
MARIMIIVAAVALLLTDRAWAQSEANCEEIRQAVATYGYEDARRHALIHYGAEAVEAGEKKCLNIQPPTKPVVTKASAKRQAPKKKKPAGPPMKLRPK